ncbi:envelope glycoprotein [Rhodotorula toruloides ATCC 204091]|uniref:BY PROTMAP: gi/342320170/gb/EGU12112.1/ envelope glycoprotein [Rhodotorula glutinis ATCC 204091] n=1 Tax=Rhodotorula toruloides TaxID=5286 RepID=A0A0K3CL39_RHOTO|nr:envelope glycoprotein [Rhodotorula toruloides ATCC 204091]PRQ71610.1 envelope glyco protein [Rhodotorula toruloides]
MGENFRHRYPPAAALPKSAGSSRLCNVWRLLLAPSASESAASNGERAVRALNSPSPASFDLDFPFFLPLLTPLISSNLNQVRSGFSFLLYPPTTDVPGNAAAMSAKPIREYDAKLLLAYHLARAPTAGSKAVARDGFQSPEAEHAELEAASDEPLEEWAAGETKL